jgi:carbonic anhydrase
MRLMEAIIDANHRAIAGDKRAGLHPAEYEGSLPLVALTCIDARLNAIFPEVMGVPQESFVWLRNAGNIITGPVSSTMRSLALACAIKGGKEIAIIGHTDCQVGKTSTMQIMDALQKMGVERHVLPANITDYFGVFGSERQNVRKAVDLVRNSPLIGPGIPVHGLLVDTDSGKLEWLINGYEAVPTLRDRWHEVVQSAGQTVDALKALTDFKIGDLKFPDTKIGEIVSTAGTWASQKIQQLEMAPKPSTPPAPPPLPTKPPVPPRLPSSWPVRPRIIGRRGPG